MIEVLYVGTLILFLALLSAVMLSAFNLLRYDSENNNTKTITLEDKMSKLSEIKLDRPAMRRLKKALKKDPRFNKYVK